MREALNAGLHAGLHAGSTGLQHRVHPAKLPLQAAQLGG